MKEVRYYIYHPRGSSKLKATNDTEAVIEFNAHWSLTLAYAAGKETRRLIRETREDITP